MTIPKRLPLLPTEPESGVRLIPATYPEGFERPRTEGECGEHRECCALVGCRWNTFLDVRPNGRIKFNFPGADDPTDLPFSTCSIEWADRPQTLEDTGLILGGITRERVRQIEIGALRNYRDKLAVDDARDRRRGKR